MFKLFVLAALVATSVAAPKPGFIAPLTYSAISPVVKSTYIAPYYSSVGTPASTYKSGYSAYSAYSTPYTAYASPHAYNVAYNGAYSPVYSGAYSPYGYSAGYAAPYSYSAYSTPYAYHY